MAVRAGPATETCGLFPARRICTLAVLTTPSHRRIPLACGIVIAVVLTAVFVPHFHRHTGLTSLIRFGGLRKEDLPPELAGVPVYYVPGHHGYDGQYYAHMALHPPWIYHDLASHYDFPSYRMRRAGLPAFAWAAGMGNPAWTVHIYSILNVLAWLALAWLLTLWTPLVDWVQFGRWSGCLLAAGVLESLRASLTDLPALLLTLGALRLWETRRPRTAAGVFAASVLTRETMALSIAGVLWPRVEDGRSGWRRAAWLGGLIVLPTALWVLYVAHYFPNSGGARGNFGWPFAAVVGGAADAVRQLARGFGDNGRFAFRLLTIFSMGVQLAVVLAAGKRGGNWWRFAVPFVGLFPLLGPAVWEGPWAVWRTELPVTVAFCLLLPANRWFWPLLVAGSLPSLHAFFRLVF